MLPYLTGPERELLDRLLNDEGGWYPFPGPQTDAYLSQADELFYGGAAGGGKTDLLLGLAESAHRKSIIFRREYPQLKGIEERMAEIRGGRIGYNSQTKLWRLPGGRTMELGAVQHEDDKEKYQGRPHDLIGFDEITHFLESQYRFLIGWNRTAAAGQRTRIVAAGNPPTTPEGEWVVGYWAPWLDDQHSNPALPGELRWFAVIDKKDQEVESGEPFLWKGELLTPKSRTFIPARVEDNPLLMAAGYKSRLQNLPEPLRTQLLEGRFNVGKEDNPWQIIPTRWVELAMERWRALEESGKGPSVPLTSVGVDVARGGKDKTVLAKRHGTWFAPLVKYAGSETPDGPTAAALTAQEVRGTAYVNVDVIGVGASVFDALIGLGYQAYPLNGAGRSDATDRTGRLGFANKRAEWYWTLREALDPDFGENVALPPDRELKADLTAPRWKLTVRGIQVESKDDIIKRIGRSPDCGDALVYSVAQPEGPSDGMVEYYDPVIISPY